MSYRGLATKEKTGLVSMISLLAIIETYVLGTQRNHLFETIVLNGHSIGFWGSNKGFRTCRKSIIKSSVLGIRESVKGAELQIEINILKC